MLNIIPKAIAPYVDDPHIVPSFKQPEGEALEFIRKAMDIFHGYEEYESKLISMKVRAVMYSVAYYLIRDCIERDFVFVIIVHISDSTFGAVKIISLRTVNILYIVVNESRMR